MKLNGTVVRERFSEILNGVKGAVDYLRAHFHVYSLDNLPFSTILVPLSVFFAIDGNREVGYNDDQRRCINRWFWRSAFSKRYGSGTLRNLKTDIEEMQNLREGRNMELGNFVVTVEPEFFTDNIFGMGNVNTKTFILLLAQAHPLSLLSGMPIRLEEKLKSANRTEYHHLMPRSFLRASGQNQYPDSILANFAFVSRADNRTLGGVAPSKYRAKMPADISGILEHAICPESLFLDDYATFVRERAALLAHAATALCE
jgi:hypothetical protein